MAQAPNDDDQNPPQENDVSVRNLVMVGLTALFVLLYVAALLGWITPLPDNAVVLRLEPILAVIIGYYFGRVPGEKNEKTLKEEVNRQAKKAKEAEQKKEQAQQEKAQAERTTRGLEQKVNDTRAVLHAEPHHADDAGMTATLSRSPATSETVAAALRVLDA